MFTKNILRASSIALAAATLLFTACKKNDSAAPGDDQTTTMNPGANARCHSYSSCGSNYHYHCQRSCGSTSACNTPYKITLDTVYNNGNGTFTWVWSVQNPNSSCWNRTPNLDHWDIRLTNCTDTDKIGLDDLISAGYSANGTTWTNFTPTLARDYSVGFNTGSVLRFNFGTSGSAKSYYRLTVAGDYDPDTNAQSVYATNSCSSADGWECFTGIGCPAPPTSGGGGGID